MNEKKHHEPFIRISKKGVTPWHIAWSIRLACVIAAFMVCAFVIVLITDYNPVEVFKEMFNGSFGTTRKVWTAMQNTAILLCISLAVTPAFKMKFWNLGAEGQVLMGALATAACMITFGSTMDPTLLIFVSIGASVLTALVWAILPAIFKAKWNTNESLFTLMMNYVAIQLVAYCITFWENPKGSNTVGIINFNSEAGWLPSVFNQQYFLNIVIVLVLTVMMFIYLKYSKQGYEISVVGESENTAKYIGINVKKVIIRTVAVSGALCGIAGFLLVAGTGHTISTDTAGGQGFTAIMVSWLAKFNPFVMMATSFLLVFLDRGSSEIATAFRLNESVSEILSGIILLFIIGSEFFINYKVSFPRFKKEGK
jgi:simple sugar transport system permease protein